MTRPAAAIGAVLCLGMPWLTSPAAAQGVEPAGATATTTLMVRVQVLAGDRANLDAVTGPGAARAQGGAAGIVVEAPHPAVLSVELRKETSALAPGAKRSRLVAGGSVRLQPDGSGRARGDMPAELTRALVAAGADSGVYVVAIAYN